MIKIIIAALFISVIAVQSKTIDDFLSTTLLGERTEAIEKLYGLEPNSLANTPAYIDIEEFVFGKLKFKMSVFCRDGECKAYSAAVSQIRIMDKSGKLKHRDNAEVYGVFELLLTKLLKTYGEAPRVHLKSRCCGCESGPLSQSYAWANEQHALMLGFHDNTTSQSITLTLYPRNEKNGEFRGDQLDFFEDLYKTKSGKLTEPYPGVIQKEPIENPGTEKENQSYYWVWILGGVVILVVFTILSMKKKGGTKK